MIEEPVPIIDTWRAMEELVKDGLVRNIGISNFKVSLIRDLLYGCSIRPSVLQV
jgi:D-xylose reductase